MYASLGVGGQCRTQNESKFPFCRQEYSKLTYSLWHSNEANVESKEPIQVLFLGFRWNTKKLG